MVEKYNYCFIICCVMLASVMRFPRVKAQGRSFYHCISRFVHGLYIFGTSGGRCAEVEDFLSLMRRWAALTGIRIRKYVLMANHFHIMCEVPEPKPLTQNEVLERIEAGAFQERAIGRRPCRGGDRRLHRSEPGASRTV
jgi:hypothetical protein